MVKNMQNMFFSNKYFNQKEENKHIKLKFVFKQTTKSPTFIFLHTQRLKYKLFNKSTRLKEIRALCKIRTEL